MVTIISTHTIPVCYIKWVKANGNKMRLWDYTIKGGSGVVDKNTLLTPVGVATSISEADLDKLMTLDSFRADIKRGFIKVLKNTNARTVDADEEAEKDMNTEGSGRQITSEDLEKDGAIINDDGSVDVSNGGKNAVARKNAEKREKTLTTITIPDEEKPKTKRGRGRGKTKGKSKKD